MSRAGRRKSKVLQFGHGCGYSCANAQHWRDSELPLVRGETLAGLYTIGTPLALWTVRFLDSGEAIRVPAPKFSHHSPGVGGEWINLFDVDDIIAWPLRCVNAHFAAAVTEDREVQSGGLFTGWNPAVHETYARCEAVIDTVVQGNVRLYERINPRPDAPAGSQLALEPGDDRRPQGVGELLAEEAEVADPFDLTSPDKCLLLETQDWHTMYNFSKDAILMVFASEYFDENDYIFEPYPA